MSTAASGMATGAPLGKSCRGKWAAMACAAVAAAATALPLFFTLPAYHLNLLMQASTYAIAVFGLTVVLGYCGQLSLAQAGFFALGAYGLGLGTTVFGLPFWLALVTGVTLATAAGTVLGLTSLRLGGHYLAMVTISFQTILSLILINWVSFTHGPDGVPGIPRPTLLADDQHYLSFCIFMLCMVGLSVWQLKQTRLGRAMQAVRDNELAAGVAGINTYGTKVAAFTLSAALGGLGGALFAGGFSYVSPDQFSFGESVVFLTMALIGGVGSAIGSVIGTGLLILLPEWLRFLKVIYLAVYGGAVILAMVFMPDGIWGFITRIWRGAAAAPASSGAPHALPLIERGGAQDGSIVLSVRGLCKHFGGLNVIDDASFEVRYNTVHALIGPNGSGKTTFLNVLSGLYAPNAGTIEFEGRAIQHMSPHRRVRLGLGRTFQNIRLFTGLTALQNVIVGAEGSGRAPAGGKTGLALAALEFVGICQRAHESVQGLSYGHQRWVEIARALAGDPKLLLLDEPGAGLNLPEKQELVALLKRLKGHGMTIFIIDHDMNLVEQVADHITVFNFGRRIADGPPAQVLRDPEVIAAYLGEVAADGDA